MPTALQIRVDVDDLTAVVDGRRVELTPTECRILASLARADGSTVSRNYLTAYALQPSFDGWDRTVDSHVSHLRRKLGAAGNLIKTVYGLGYTLEAGYISESKGELT